MLHGLSSYINEPEDGHGSQGEGERVTRMTQKALLTNGGRGMSQIPTEKAMREKRERETGDDEESVVRVKKAKKASGMSLTGGQ